MCNFNHLSLLPRNYLLHSYALQFYANKFWWIYRSHHQKIVQTSVSDACTYIVQKFIELLLNKV